eukprot:COSAG03_NODE_21457_length_304_cov_0.297561_1_plen_55_part_10
MTGRTMSRPSASPAIAKRRRGGEKAKGGKLFRDMGLVWGELPGGLAPAPASPPTW